MFHRKPLQCLIGIFRSVLPVQSKPEIEDAKEIRTVGSETAMRGIRLRRFFKWTFARIGNTQKRHDHQHFRQNFVQVCFQQHFAQLRVKWQSRQRTPDPRQTHPVKCAQIVQRAHAFADQRRRRFVHQGKLSERRQIQRRHLQDHSGKRRALNLRRCELRTFIQRFFRIKMNANTIAQTTATTAALTRACLRNLLHPEFLNPGARIITAETDESRIDHIADSGDRQRRFSDIGRKDDPAETRRTEHPLLISGGKTAEQRQDLGIRKPAAVEDFGTITDLPLSGEKNQNVAVRVHIVDERHSAHDRLGQLLVLSGFQPAVLNRKQTPFDFLHRSSVKKLRETFRIQRGG